MNRINDINSTLPTCHTVLCICRFHFYTSTRAGWMGIAVPLRCSLHARAAKQRTRLPPPPPPTPPHPLPLSYQLLGAA